MDLQLRVSAQGAQELEQNDTRPPRLAEYAEELQTFTQLESHSSLADVTLPSPPSQIVLNSKTTLFLESAYLVTRSTHRLQNPLDTPASADTWPDLGDMLLGERMRLQRALTTETQQMSTVALKQVDDSINIVLETRRDLESHDVVESCSVSILSRMCRFYG